MSLDAATGLFDAIDHLGMRVEEYPISRERLGSRLRWGLAFRLDAPLAEIFPVFIERLHPQGSIIRDVDIVIAIDRCVASGIEPATAGARAAKDHDWRGLSARTTAHCALRLIEKGKARTDVRAK